jgi:hypothetical protein
VASKTVPYELRVAGREGEGAPGALALANDAHELLADAIVRGAGGLRLLRRLVDPDRAVEFRADEVRGALQELEVLREGLEEEERRALARTIERLEELFARAERARSGVRGRGSGNDAGGRG